MPKLLTGRLDRNGPNAWFDMFVFFHFKNHLQRDTYLSLLGSHVLSDLHRGAITIRHSESRPEELHGIVGNVETQFFPRALLSGTNGSF